MEAGLSGSLIKKERQQLENFENEYILPLNKHVFVTAGVLTPYTINQETSSNALMYSLLMRCECGLAPMTSQYIENTRLQTIAQNR